MPRRFTAASSERIYIGTAGLAGLDFAYGTLAVCLWIVSVSVNSQALLATNDGATTGVEWYIHGTGTNGSDLSWYGTTNVDSFSTLAVTTGENLLVAITKATGSVLPRAHMYKFATGAWTHGDCASNIGDAATATALCIGAFANAGSSDHLDGELHACAAWNKLAMSDLEVERLARQPDWSRFAPDMYESASDGRDVGDMMTTIGRYRCKQTARTGTTKGVQSPPPGFRSRVQRRRR